MWTKKITSVGILLSNINTSWLFDTMFCEKIEVLDHPVKSSNQLFGPDYEMLKYNTFLKHFLETLSAAEPDNQDCHLTDLLGCFHINSGGISCKNEGCTDKRKCLDFNPFSFHSHSIYAQCSMCVQLRAHLVPSASLFVPSKSINYAQ